MIRPLKYVDLHESFALSQFAFQMEQSQGHHEEKREQTNPEYTWGYFDEGKLASIMTILPLQIYLQGKMFRMGGIAGVATWPEFRRQGMVAKLLENALQVMKEKGESLSFLYPFSFSFYRKYGWELFCEYKKYTIEVDKLPIFPNVEGKIKRIGNDITLLNSIYEAYALRFNGMIMRDEDWWNQRIIQRKKGIVAVYFNKEGNPDGYMIYSVQNREMNIYEMVCLNHRAERGMWLYIKNHDSMIEKVTLQAPSSDQLPYLLDQPRIGQEIVPFFMARIVDVEAFISQFPFTKQEQEINLFIHVTDEQAAWNQGTFQVKIDIEGNAEVKAFQKEQEGSACTHPPERGIQCSIQTLTAFFLGYQRPQYLYEIDLLQGKEDEVLQWEELIPHRTPYLIDFF